MAKELPYFRFTPQEWQNGDVSLEDYSIKGLFIDVCAYYWVNDCSLTKTKLEKKFSNASLEVLFSEKIIKVARDLLEINFLDEQWKMLGNAHKKRSKAGKIGGLRKASNAKAMLKPGSSYKDKDKDKDKDNKKNIKKNSTPISFSKTPFFEDKELWCKKLEPWPQDESLRYWENANNYSNKGKKYIDWILAVKGWARRANDKPQGQPQQGVFLTAMEKQDLEMDKIMNKISNHKFKELGR